MLTVKHPRRHRPARLGTYLVRTSVLRVYGAELRRFLSVNVGNRFLALLAGLSVTGLLQSSTATALLTTLRRQRLIATAAFRHHAWRRYRYRAGSRFSRGI